MKSFDPDIFTKGFKDDNWPYCPECGKDNLFLNSKLSLKCKCGWNENPCKFCHSRTTHHLTGCPNANIYIKEDA